MKKCKACNIKKDLSQFHTDKQKKKDNLAVNCKSCVATKNKAKYDANKPSEKHKQIKNNPGNLKGCLYKVGTNLITNVYSYKSSNR